MNPYKRVHFVGIGGCGMSAIARVLLARGIEVTGSDLKQTPTLERLQALGATVIAGHASDNIQGADAVVISSAIPYDNPEVIAAQRAGIAVVPRAQMLAYIMAGKRSIGVAGTHGKTTTTSMIGAILEGAGMNPTIIVGGNMASTGINARMGDGETVVAEADESDASLLRLAPACAVITNIENDHLGYYRDLDHLVDTFWLYAQCVPANGYVVASADCMATRRVIGRLRREPQLYGDPAVLTFGFSGVADVRGFGIELTNFGSSFGVTINEKNAGRIDLAVPGKINALNALASITVARCFGVDMDACANALRDFRGVARRFQILHHEDGVAIVDDYAHHPTAVRETIAAARAYWPGRIIVAFQPHRYSRTSYLMRDFAQALLGADIVMITDIYAAGEQPIPGVRSEGIVDAILAADREKTVSHTPTTADALALLKATVTHGDLVLTLGAGDISVAAHELSAFVKGTVPSIPGESDLLTGTK